MNISNPYIHRLISLERKWVILSSVKRFATSIWMQIPFPHVINFYYPNAFFLELILLTFKRSVVAHIKRSDSCDTDFNFSSILDSIEVSIPACHAGDPGSIPGRGVQFLSIDRINNFLFPITVL